MTARVKFTLDGLKVDSDEAPIPGLYAAGEITGHLHHSQPPQTSVLRASTFGRLIGASVAEPVPDKAASTG